MCMVLIKEPENKVGFIIYNHLYGRKERDFTLRELTDELRNYKLNLNDDDVARAIEPFIMNGKISRRVGYYTYCGNRTKR